jgi:hypothetical protein
MRKEQPERLAPIALGFQRICFNMTRLQVEKKNRGEIVRVALYFYVT